MPSDIVNFVANYGSPGRSDSIAVKDENAEFRSEVITYVVEHPNSATQSLMEDLILNESIWSRSGPAKIGLLVLVISQYINRFPSGIQMITLAAGNSMDLDGALQSGELTLTDAAQAEAIKNMELLPSSLQNKPSILVMKRALENANVIDS